MPYKKEPITISLRPEDVSYETAMFWRNLQDAVFNTLPDYNFKLCMQCVQAVMRAFEYQAILDVTRMKNTYIDEEEAARLREAGVEVY